MDSNNQIQQSAIKPTQKKSRRFLRTALLMGGSALLGGLAVAIFNRKQIETIHQGDGKHSPPTGQPELDEDA